MDRKLKQVDIVKYVNSNIQKLLFDEEYLVRLIDPNELLLPERLDIVVKYIYALNKLQNNESDFYTQLYLEHIKAFNYYVEADRSLKIGKEAFLKCFNDTIDSICNNGIKENTYIPLDVNNIPLDGAHRIAIAMVLNKNLPVFNLSISGTHNFDYNFWGSRGLDSDLMDYMTIEYAKLKKNTYVILVWPRAKGHEDEIFSILNKKGKIVNFKSVKMRYEGIVNLQLVTYQHESWLGNYYNDFEGAQTKAMQCYNEGGCLRIFLFESFSDLVSIKKEIRDIFLLDKHAVHINDTHEETVEIANLVFNRHNIHRLNCSVRKEMKVFNKLFNEFKLYLDSHAIDKSQIAIIGGVLALYGVKDSKDLDYITTLKGFPVKISSSIELETKKIDYTHYSVADLINDPRLYFVYDGIKFICLEVLLEIKKQRNNDNDKRDAQLMGMLINTCQVKYTLWDKVKICTSLSYYRRNIKMFLLNIRYWIFKYWRK